MPGSCQRPDVLALWILVRPVKMNPGPVLYRPLPAKSGRLLAGIQAMSPGPGEIAWGLRKPA
jgi:hypothetical protein